MAQHYADMYQDYPSNRSPPSVRGYGGNNISLNRQTSRQFDNYNSGQMQLYTADDYVQRQPEPVYGRMPSVAAPSNYAYEAQTWGYGGANNNGASMMGGTGRMKTSSARRGQIPSVSLLALHVNPLGHGTNTSQTWMEQPVPQSQNANNYQFDYNHSQMMPSYQSQSPPLEKDELIPTAIVIKNIPFAIRKEELLAMMTDIGLPLPYAFNYHFDNGVFRGLAFANFTTADETATVIQAMNNLMVKDRKLRVEYKRMLPAHERERIEREKRQKRGQLQEQHQPLPPGQIQNPLQPRSSMNSLSSAQQPPTSPSPVSFRQPQASNLRMYRTFFRRPSLIKCHCAQ